MVGPAIIAAAGGTDVIFKEVDNVRVRGKGNSTRIFEPLGMYGIWIRIKKYWKTWPF